MWVAMDNRIAVAERLQQLFAESSGHSIWIMDQSGKLIASPVFASDTDRVNYEKVGHTIKPMTSSLLRYGLADGPVLMDMGDSEHQIVTSVIRNHLRQFYYICVGPIRVEADKTDLIRRAAQFAQLMTEYFNHANNDARDKVRGQAMELLAGRMQQGGIEVSEVQEFLRRAGVEYDFLGYASRSEDFQFKVTQTDGKLGDKLEGASFFAGEGYLGQLVISGQSNWWHCAARDPRLRIFNELQIQPELLFAYPVKRDRSVVGLLFYGLEHGSPHPRSDLHIHWCNLITSLLSEGMTRRMLQADLEIQVTRMRTLMEAVSLLSNANELIRAMYLVIDITLTLICDAQAAICLIKNPDTGKIKMVSRGLAEDRAERYAQALTNKYLQAGAASMTGLGSESLEIRTVHTRVIRYQDQVLGVLGVDLSEGELTADSELLLDSLTTLSAIAINRSQGEIKSDKSVVTLLYDSMLQLDPARSAIVSTYREMAGQFGVYLQLSPQQLHNIDEAAALLAYELEFLEAVPIREELIRILEGSRALDKEQTGAQSYPLESQVLRVACCHVDRGKTASSDTQSSSDIDKQFQAFLIYREMMSRELAASGLREDSSAVGAARDSEELAFAALSPREMDVLKLIAEGSNNKAIAEALFISEHTVKNHITNIFSKLGVTDRSHLIALVYQQRHHPRIAGALD